MGTTRIQLNIPAFNAYRNEQSVVDAMEAIANEIAGRANSAVTTHEDPGDPFVVETVHNRSRAVTFVRTANIDGRLAEAHHRTLSLSIQ